MSIFFTLFFRRNQANMQRNTLSICLVIIFLFLFCQATQSSALTYTFSDKDFLGGSSWGALSVTAVDADTLMVRYDSSALIPSGSQITGFGFTFIPETLAPGGVSNPGNSDFAGDRDNLTWIALANLNCIPNPANGDEFDPDILKSDYFFGVTEGNPNNINPPGILPGEFDIFYLNFSGVPDLTALSDLSSLISITGIRLQSLPCSINHGSLFLTGTPEAVPEPETLLLLGSGLLSVVFFARRKQ
jgi:hypothetical protein